MIKFNDYVKDKKNRDIIKPLSHKIKNKIYHPILFTGENHYLIWSKL